MSATFTIAYKRKHAGTFSQIKNVWSALQQLEGIEDLESKLILVDRRSSARKEEVPLSYARLCTQLREVGRADIRRAGDEEPIPFLYGVWEREMNVLDMTVLMEEEA